MLLTLVGITLGACGGIVLVRSMVVRNASIMEDARGGRYGVNLSALKARIDGRVDGVWGAGLIAAGFVMQFLGSGSGADAPSWVSYGISLAIGAGACATWWTHRAYRGSRDFALLFGKLGFDFSDTTNLKDDGFLDELGRGLRLRRRRSESAQAYQDRIRSRIEELKHP